MGAWLESLLPWGYSVINWVQQGQHPVLTAIFKGLTFFGGESSYLLVLPILFWCVNDRLGRRLGFVLFTGFAINLLCKAAFGIPRPDATLVFALANEHTPSFPSGHAQGTLILWGYILVWWRNVAARISIPILLFLIGFSRIYLGVHFPQDVIGGWLISGVILSLFVWAEPKFTPRVQKWPSGVLIFLLVSIPLALFSLHWIPGMTAPTVLAKGAIRSLTSACAVLLGFGLGVFFERKWVGFSSDGKWPERAKRFFIGALPVAMIYVGLKKILPEGLDYRFLRYALTGLAASWWAPWLLVKTQLADSSFSLPTK